MKARRFPNLPHSKDFETEELGIFSHQKPSEFTLTPPRGLIKPIPIRATAPSFWDLDNSIHPNSGIKAVALAERLNMKIMDDLVAEIDTELTHGEITGRCTQKSAKETRGEGDGLNTGQRMDIDVIDKLLADIDEELNNDKLTELTTSSSDVTEPLSPVEISPVLKEKKSTSIFGHIRKLFGSSRKRS